MVQGKQIGSGKLADGVLGKALGYNQVTPRYSLKFNRLLSVLHLNVIPKSSAARKNKLAHRLSGLGDLMDTDRYLRNLETYVEFLICYGQQ